MIIEAIIGVINVMMSTWLDDCICLWTDYFKDNEPVKVIDYAKYEKIKKIATNLKLENVKLKKMNDDFILQGVQMLNTVKDKNQEIEELKVLIVKHEEAMIKLLDNYKYNRNKLATWKEQAVQTMDTQAGEISRLKIINLKLLAELKKYKKD